MNVNQLWQRMTLGLAGVLAVVGVVCLGVTAASAQTSERLSPQLERHTSIALLIDPVSGRIVDANAAAEAFYGYSATALRSMVIQDINRLGPEEVAAERAKAAREQRDYFIFPHKVANGSIRTVEVYSSPVKGADGHTLLVSIIHDISGKAVPEEELSAYRARLEELVEQRTSRALVAEERLRFWLIAGLALQAVLIVLLALAILRRHATVRQLQSEVERRTSAETKLGKAKADLQRFAEISAHHLREPTRHLMIFSQKLRKRLGRPADEDMELSLATIETEAAYLHALVRDVQVYLAADTPLGSAVGVDAGEIARAVVAGMGAALSDCKGAVVIGRLPSLPVDSVRLKGTSKNPALRR
jgi:chemotaxis family two-component system sensor kinase Cph1